MYKSSWVTGLCKNVSTGTMPAPSYKWLNCVPINQMIGLHGPQETTSVWQRKMCRRVVLEDHLKIESCRGWFPPFDTREQLQARERPASAYQTVSGVLLHLRSLPLQQQTGQHPWISLFLPPAQMFSLWQERGPPLPHRTKCGCLKTLMKSLDLHINNGCESPLSVPSFLERNHMCKEYL